MNTKRDFPQLDMLLSGSSLTASRYCIAHLTFILFDDEKKISRTIHFLFGDAPGQSKEKLTIKNSRAG